jgi:hypothetical protein
MKLLNRIISIVDTKYFLCNVNNLNYQNDIYEYVYKLRHLFHTLRVYVNEPFVYILNNVIISLA